MAIALSPALFSPTSSRACTGLSLKFSFAAYDAAPPWKRNHPCATPAEVVALLRGFQDRTKILFILETPKLARTAFKEHKSRTYRCDATPPALIESQPERPQTAPTLTIPPPQRKILR